MSGAFISLRSNCSGTLLELEYNATHAAKARLRKIPPGAAIASINWTHILPGKGHVTYENVNISISVNRELTVSTGSWIISVQISSFPFSERNRHKVLLDVAISPERGYDPDADPVAPHGLIGQSYDGDGIGISGAVDDPVKDGKSDRTSRKELTTRAQAEGAIEGDISEYRVANRFDTNFKYSRFDSDKAPHRDTLKLSGTRSNATFTPRTRWQRKPTNGSSASMSAVWTNWKPAGAGGAGFLSLAKVA
jgi:hypothetical protein